MAVCACVRVYLGLDHGRSLSEEHLDCLKHVDGALVPHPLQHDGQRHKHPRPSDTRAANHRQSTSRFVSQYVKGGWLGSRVVSVLDSGAEGPGFKSQLRRCRVTVLGKLFTPIVPLFTKQQNW